MLHLSHGEGMKIARAVNEEILSTVTKPAQKMREKPKTKSRLIEEMARQEEHLVQQA